MNMVIRLEQDATEQQWQPEACINDSSWRKENNDHNPFYLSLYELLIQVTLTVQAQCSHDQISSTGQHDY